MIDPDMMDAVSEVVTDVLRRELKPLHMDILAIHDQLKDLRMILQNEVGQSMQMIGENQLGNNDYMKQVAQRLEAIEAFANGIGQHLSQAPGLTPRE